MLVDINLLPEKEPKKINIWILISGLAALFLLTGCYYFVQIQSSKTSIETLGNEISTLKKGEAISNNNAAKSAENNEVSQLKAAVKWAKSYPIQTVPVMQHLVSLLPERGFIQSFNYTDIGEITISVQFDTPSDAAYFLDNLTSAKWIKAASLDSLNAGSDSNATGTNTGNANNNTNTSAGTNNQSSNNNTTTNINTQSDNGNTSSSSTGSQNLSNGQAPATNQINDSAAVPSANKNSNSVNSPVTSGSTTASSNTADSKYLPRYTGQYTIILNQDEAKKLMAKGQNNGSDVQGVNGS